MNESPSQASMRPEPRAYPWRAILGVLVVIAIVAFVLMLRVPTVPTIPPASTSHVEVKPSPNVIVAVRDLSRLETTTFHMERVVELKDEQSKLWGILQAKDALLLVAVGDVTAGVDLSKVKDEDAIADWPKKKVRIVLPAPEIFAARIDNSKTHVYARSTDTFASRNESLEGLARAEAEKSMKKSAEDGGILDRAKAAAERAVRALLTSLGFTDVEIAWR